MAKRIRTGSEKKAKKRVKIEEEADVENTEVKNEAEDSQISKKQKNGKKSAKSAEVKNEAEDSQKSKKQKNGKKSAKSAVVKSAKSTDADEGSKAIFLKKKIEIAVSLYPGSLRNCEESVENSIGELLLAYSEGLGGILMAYDNVKLKSDENGQGRGWILNELPHIHYNASCDALVFSPRVGCKLHGIVSECFPSHLGILVFNYFNAMVSADQLHASGYSFDPDLQNWATEGGAQTISIEDKINFVVAKVHECEGTVSLEGVTPSLSLLVERR